MTELSLKPKKFRTNCLIGSFLCRPLGSLACSVLLCILSVCAIADGSYLCYLYFSTLFLRDSSVSFLLLCPISWSVLFIHSLIFFCLFVHCFEVGCPVKIWYLPSLSRFQYVSTILCHSPRQGKDRPIKNNQTNRPATGHLLLFQFSCKRQE